MKIKEIKIENFGKLSGFSKTFADGINVINEENGWGKSTLAAFIRVMFFGFNDENKKKNADREREHYRPWQGGTYGGSIIFEANGKEYRMNRIFAGKASDDTFALYDNTTSLVSTDFSEKIGEELFKLDADSFQKTVLIEQNDVETKATDSISAKLGNLAGVTDDVNKYNAVMEDIVSKLNALGLGKRRGQIQLIEDQITKLSDEVRSIPNAEKVASDRSAELDALKQRLEDINNAAAEYNNELKEASKFAELKTKKEQYDSIIERYTAREDEKRRAESAFPVAVPEEADLDQNIRAAKNVQDTKLEAAEYKLSADEEAYLARNERYFSAGIDSNKFDSYEEQIAIIEKAEKEYNALQFSEEEKADYEKYTKKFAGKGDVEHEASQLSNDLIQSNSIKASIPGSEVLLQNYNLQAAKNNSVLWLILLIAGIAAVAAGAALAFTVSKIAGIITAAAGAVCAVIGIIIKLSSKQSKSVQESAHAYENLKTKLESDKRFVDATESAVKHFLDQFGIESDFGSAFEELSNLKSEYRRYKDLAAKESDQRDDNLLDIIRGGKEDVDAFFAPFDGLFTAEAGYNARLQMIRYEAGKYNEIKSKRKAYDGFAEAISSKEKPVLEYLNSLGFSCTGVDLIAMLSEIKEKLVVFQRACEEFDAVKSERKRFEESNNTDEIAASDTASGLRSVDELHSLIAANNNARDDAAGRISECSSILSEDLERLDNLREKEELLIETEDNLNGLKKRGELISKTKDLLEKAKTRFTGKYSNAVANGFRKYYELADGTKGNEYSFNSNMDLMIDDHGGYKDVHSYSLGSRDKIGICFRLGLVDAMYPGEKPVIIMDDPFTNLDPRRIEGGKKLLDVLKNEYQIIYFTCHESRMPS